MGVALLDSSAVIGYLDREDLLHREAVPAVEKAIRHGTTVAISAITWAELLHGAFLGHRDESYVREFAHDFGVDIIAADATVAERAAALQAAFARTGRAGRPRRLRTADALILATADVNAGVETVICGDDQWPRVPGVRPRVRLLRERRR